MPSEIRVFPQSVAVALDALGRSRVSDDCWYRALYRRFEAGIVNIMNQTIGQDH